MDVAGKTVVVLGCGLSGRAAAKFLKARGAEVIAFDDSDPKRSCDGPFDLLVPSPGVPPSHPLYQKALSLNIPILGEAELALREIRQPVIGITGTNGKTTVTEMTAHILNRCGIKAAALGNNGSPLSEWALYQDESIIVAELSSYQLETMQTRSLDRAVILNISPDHLDRYGTMEAYTAAKFRILRCLKPPAPLLVHPSLIRPGCQSYINDALGDAITFEDENRHAAFALAAPLGIGRDQFIEALESFRKPPHRLELVREAGGVRYMNDSKGTNVDAVLKAVHACRGSIFLIAGGKDKGESYSSWVSTFSGKVAAISLIGEASEKIHRELSPHFPVKQCGTLAQALAYCQSLARPGDTILLSPGCSSFDQYRSFEERGEEFRTLVASLPESN